MADSQMAAMMANTGDRPNEQYQTSVWVDLL
jgi:hypothetical protein